jgi:two-component system sensor histidine kinase UhpB
VQDNGKGIDTERLLNRESWGILGMYERTRHFGGELRITGTPGQGTLVDLRLPMEKRNAE